MRWFPVLLVVGGCVDMEDRGPTIVGTSGDVTTEPGDYTGYRVVSPCEDSFVNIGVIGTGSIDVPDANDISALGSELGASLRDVTSVWGSAGYGLACEPGLGTSIYTNDWRDVDMLIARIGEFLRDRDVALQVGVNVGSQPVPVSSR